MKATHELVQIATAGGGLRLGASSKATHELIQIAAAASAKQVQIADEKLKEDAQIVSSGEYDPSLGESCEFCDKTYEEELQEKL